jgi:putative ABC transport system permease protein
MANPAAAGSGPAVIPISDAGLAIAAGLIVLAGLLSLILRLDLEKRLGIASVRTAVQLLLVGLVLEWIFRSESPLIVTAWMLVMFGFATYTAASRPSRTYPGLNRHSFLTLVLTGAITTFTVTELVVGVDPWYEPQYVIPLLGMVLGNSMTGISLCVDTLLDSLSRNRSAVETELALGATRWEAAGIPVAEAIRKGLIPTINRMSVVGVVFLPGMMTGQILAHQAPMEAVKYQIVVMFMIAAAVAIGATAGCLLVFLRLFNDRHQLQSRDIAVRE